MTSATRPIGAPGEVDLGQEPDPLVARIAAKLAAKLADIPRGPIYPDREPLLADGDDDDE